MVLERILFNVISVAFVLLLLTTVSGGLFSEEIFGRPLTLNHKTVFSLVATIFFDERPARRRAHRHSQ